MHNKPGLGSVANYFVQAIFEIINRFAGFVQFAYIVTLFAQPVKGIIQSFGITKSKIPVIPSIYEFAGLQLFQ